MKLIPLIIVCALAACGGKQPAPSTPTTNADPAPTAAPTGDGTPCSQEIALECPEGQIDGCLKTPAEGTTHACVTK
ncbi:MAG: hypothetical protein SFX73_39055 [Kofleriaceae bacterium]|nr:hypothetical protein [Kofleriaceae bacterium]